MIKKLSIAFAALIATLALSTGLIWAQTSGPTIFTTRLTVNPGPVTITGTTTVNGQLLCLADGTNCAAPTESSGTFTGTWDDACTTSPTTAFKYRKVGTLVYLNWDNMSPTTCTSDSITFDDNALNEAPAAIRPTSTQASGYTPVTDNGLSRKGQVSITTTGAIQIRLCVAESAASAGLQCSVNLWTNAGTKSLQAGTMVYSTAW